MVGLALFGVASCIIAAAGAQTELLAGRALQGLAAALAVPGTLAAVDTSAAPERRGSAIGAWTGLPASDRSWQGAPKTSSTHVLRCPLRPFIPQFQAYVAASRTSK